MTSAITVPTDTSPRPSPMELAVRIGILVLWATWCFRIIHPLLPLLVWGVVIAVALHPLHKWLCSVLGGRARSSAILLTVAMLLLLAVPVVVLSGVIVNNVRTLADSMSEGTLTIPPPPESVAGWPLVGARTSELWSLASSNVDALLEQHRPEIQAAGGWLLEAAAGAGLSVIEFIAAVIIAGVLLLHSAAGHRLTHGICRRLAGAGGAQLADLAEATVRGVARGVLGVALIQALMAGLGMLLAGVPAAGLLTVLCLLLCVAQIGAGPVLIPAAIYLFSTASVTTAVLFLAWSIVVMLIDNVLKPMLMGRGVDVPMAVIFLGSIGGLLLSGIIGLFVGAVILALGYRLFLSWLDPAPPTTTATIVPSD